MPGSCALTIAAAATEMQVAVATAAVATAVAAAATVTEALILRADLYAALGGSCGRGCIDIGGEGDSGGGGGGGCLATVAAASTAAAATDARHVVAVGSASRGANRSSRGCSITLDMHRSAQRSHLPVLRDHRRRTEIDSETYTSANNLGSLVGVPLDRVR